MRLFKAELSRQYLINLITTFLSQACSAGMIIVITPVLQRNFSTEEFANYGVLLNIVLFAAAFDLGLNMGLMRRLIHERDKATALISSVFFLYIVLFITLVPVFLLLYFSGAVDTGNNFLYHALLTALLVIQAMVAMLFDVVLQSTNKIFIGKFIRIGKTFLELMLLLSCSHWGSATLLLLVSGLVNCVYIFVLFWFSRKEVDYHISSKTFSAALLIDHIRYSFWYFLNSISVVLAFNSQIIMLNGLMGKMDVAKYILVSRFMDVVRLGSTNFTIILFPSLALLEARGEWNNLRHNYFTILKRVIVFSIVMLLFLLTAGKYIFIWWSRNSSQDILQLYNFSAVFIILIIIDNVSSVFLHAFRLNKVQTLLSIVQGFIGLLAGYFLLHKYGLVGMAFGSLIAIVCTNLIYNPAFLISQFRKKTNKWVVRS